MAVNRREVITNQSPKTASPIEYITENGFSIIRRCDLDNSKSRSGTTHSFIVRDPDGYELELVVEIAGEVVAEVNRRSFGRLSIESSYWIALAERHLAYYLWKNDDYPPNAALRVDQLALEDLDLIRRWDRHV